MSEVKKDIMKYLKKNPYPADEKVHAHAEQKGVAPDKEEEGAYSLLSDFLAKGKRNKEPEKKLDPKQIEKGVKVESEHTSNPALAKRIAQDHLVEIGDYYDRLDKMESAAKKGKTAGLIKEARHVRKMFEKAMKGKKKKTCEGYEVEKIAGGPGSGSGKLTKQITSHFKGLAISPKISIGKRKAFMAGKKPKVTDEKIPIGKIRYVAQERFLPEKVNRISKLPDVADLPVDVLKDKEGLYHIMDGHHRFLGALKKGIKNLKANVWQE